jgi:hypothetical protein
MNRIKIKLGFALLLMCASISVGAQINRTLATKVADILAQLPAENLDHSDKLMQEIVDLKADGVLKFCDMIVPLGTGDDTKARFAIESVAIYSGGLNTVIENSAVEDALLLAIQNATNNEVKTFYIERLTHCGSDVSVETLRGFLSDAKMYKPALSALSFIGSTKAADAIFSATKGVNNAIKASLIVALGSLRYESAVSSLQQWANSESVLVQEKSLAALAEIAAVSSSKVLITAAEKADYKLDKSGAIISLIHYGKRLKEEGQLELSTSIGALLLKNCKEEEQLHFRSAGIDLLRSNLGRSFNKTLLKEIKNSNKNYRGAVLVAATNGQTSEEVAAWVKAYKKAKGTVKAQIVSMLQTRDEPVVFEKVITTSVLDEDVNVRIAGVKALVYVNKEVVLPLALQTLATANTQDEFSAIEGTLLRICSAEDNIALANYLTKLSNNGKVVVVNVLAARKASDQFEQIVALVKSDDKGLKSAAYAALPAVVSASHLSKVIGLLSVTDDAENINSVQNAIVGILDTSKKDNSQLILDAYRNIESKEHVLPVLSALGSTALDLVLNSLNSENEKEQMVALVTLSKWRNNDALIHLYGAVKSSKNKELRAKAFGYYLSQVTRAKFPNEQKLLLIQKLMPLSTSLDEQKKIIGSARGIKTFLSLIFVSEYLNVEGLTTTASNTAIRIALPTPGKKNGLSGKLVRKIVSKSVSNLTGPDSQYTKIDVQEFLDNMSDEEGFVSIFNGKDFTGWEGLVKNPIARGKMSEKELVKAQIVANEQMMRDWYVNEGVFGFKGEGYNNICTIKDYADFEMIVDWKITNGGDSGIYLRGTPQVQIWDIARVDAGAQVGSGGLYNNQKNERIPIEVADNPVNEWNNFRIKMVGERVTVWLNGVLVTDNVALENYWDRKSAIFAKEAIELQAHGEDLGFKNIYVREISSGDNQLTEEEQKEGFKSLLNGKDLDHWIGNKTDYIVESNELKVRPKNGGHGNLLTAAEYSDFNFRFEFKLTPGANNGLGIHMPLHGDAAYEGKELQILDNTAAIYANLKPYQYHGSVYGIIAAKRGYLNPVGDWNSQEVIVNGDGIKIILNGTVIVDGNMKEAAKNGPKDGKSHPGLKRNNGHIGFLGHGASLEFRNIRIKNLSK